MHVHLHVHVKLACLRYKNALKQRKKLVNKINVMKRNVIQLKTNRKKKNKNQNGDEKKNKNNLPSIFLD